MSDSPGTGAVASHGLTGTALKILDRVRECLEAVDAAGLFLHAFDTQHVSYSRTRFDKA